MRPGSAPLPGKPRRHRRPAGFLLALLAAMPAAAVAQAPDPRAAARADPARTAPVREDPANWWGDVHGWTGSDATRPRGGGTTAQPTAPAAARAPAAQAARGSVLTSPTTRANIRREPSLNAPVVRRMAPGSRLSIFGEAPGGWLHVGDTEPYGWAHESVLQR